MKLKVIQMNQVGSASIMARCPHCGRQVVFEAVGQDILIAGNIICGQRRCPAYDCYGHIFIITDQNKLIASYPPVSIDFDASNIPEQVAAPFKEAIECHAAGYHTAAAIMIRRTLEAICVEKEAEGKNLKTRIQALSSKVILPKELLAGIDELRLLGNGAAHVSAEDYATISDDELRVAIEFAKEILKALYQYSALLEKLRALKPPGTPASS